jgi:hypothetical protein
MYLTTLSFVLLTQLLGITMSVNDHVSVHDLQQRVLHELLQTGYQSSDGW